MFGHGVDSFMEGVFRVGRNDENSIKINMLENAQSFSLTPSALVQHAHMTDTHHVLFMHKVALGL